MGTIIIILVVWTIAAFICSKVKNCSMFSAYGKVICGLFAGIMSQATDAEKAARRRAEQEGRDDIIDQLDEKDQVREQMHSFFDNHKD